MEVFYFFFQGEEYEKEMFVFFYFWIFFEGVTFSIRTNNVMTTTGKGLISKLNQNVFPHNYFLPLSNSKSDKSIPKL